MAARVARGVFQSPHAFPSKAVTALVSSAVWTAGCREPSAGIITLSSKLPEAPAKVMAARCRDHLHAAWSRLPPSRD